MSDILPSETFAIVVGIERYDVSDRWNLNGPATDAVRFVDWLITRGVPAANISLHLSSIEANAGLPVPGGIPKQLATIDRFDKLLTQELPARTEKFLILYWGGHGIMQSDGNRYLFAADAAAENKRTLPIGDLMRFLRSNAIPRGRFEQQLLIVDACANFTDVRTMSTAITAMQFPHGIDTVDARHQFVLLAARPGEKAANLNAEQTGLFSRELRALLTEQPDATWPPNMDTVTDALIKRFITLRNEGSVKQTPAYFSAGPWESAVKTLGSVPSGRIQNVPQLSSPLVWRIVDALELCPSMVDYDERKAVLIQLRRQLLTAIRHSDVARTHLFNIVTVCAGARGGLVELFGALRMLDSSAAVDEVLGIVHQELPTVYEEIMSR